MKGKMAFLENRTVTQKRTLIWNKKQTFIFINRFIFEIELKKCFEA